MKMKQKEPEIIKKKIEVSKSYDYNLPDRYDAPNNPSFPASTKYKSHKPVPSDSYSLHSTTMDVAHLGSVITE